MSRRHRAAVTALTAALALSAIAAAAPDAGAAIAAKRRPNEVVVKTFRFRPDPIEVAAGTKVVWRNADAIEHTVTSDAGAPAELDGVLEDKGAKYAVRLREPGTYEYFCSRHPSMRGTVVVD